MSRYTQAVLIQLDRIFGRGTVAGESEGALLGRFLADGDESALTALVARHGPMVLGVCRRVLRDDHDVEDAFQATFLVLVRRAAAIRDGDRLGPWLYGVAHRVAVRARANAARQHRTQSQNTPAIEAAAVPPSEETALAELREVLDDELARLPESLRVPLVLCYLEGLTHDEAADRLGWPVGTVRSRMARGRDRLRRRLSRRGFGGDEAILTAALTSPPVSPTLVDATVKASLGFASSKLAAAAVPGTAAVLAHGVLRTMFLTKLQIIGAAAIACLVAVAGVQTYAYQFGGVGGKAAADTPVPGNDRGPGRVLQKLGEVQTQLGQLARQSATLQKTVQELQAEVAALPSQPPATGPEAVSLLKVEASKNVVAGSPQEISIIEGPEGIKALHIKGSRITRVGVFNPRSGKWHAVDLREPVDEAVPEVGPRWAFYDLGRCIYAFTGGITHKGRWGVLELPEGAKPQRVGTSVLQYAYAGHFYSFDMQSGQWQDFDTHAFLDTPEKPRDAKNLPK